MDVSQTPEAIAYLLLTDIARSENKFSAPPHIKADREWLLDTYAECLQATKNERKIRGS